MSHRRLSELRASIVRDQSGFSVVELMMVTVLLTVVLGAILTLFETTARVAPAEIERTHAVRDAQVGLTRMVRELRQAYSVLGTTESSLDIRVRVGGQDLHVLYQCGVAAPDDPSNPYDQDYRRCVRLAAVNPDATTAGTLPALSSGEVVIDRVLNGTSANPIFTYTPNAVRPTYARAKIDVPARGERSTGFSHSVVLDDGFYLRNIDLGG